MKLNRFRTLILFLSIILSSSLFSKELIMATTTSTDNTGLLDYLAPKYKKDTGNSLKWVATGTGNALKMGQNCDVDILFVHAPQAEKKFVKDGFGINRKQVMYNDFIIVGPKSDPAQASSLTSAQALKTIQDKNEKFFSRGDNSGTHKKELSLWKEAVKDIPEKQKWYVQTGQGMLRTIGMAAEKGGYTMTDRGTWIKYVSQKGDKNSLKIIVEGDKTLFNQYSVITIDNKRCKKADTKLANEFTNWIVKPENQKYIADFKLLGEPLFVPNAKN